MAQHSGRIGRSSEKRNDLSVCARPLSHVTTGVFVGCRNIVKLPGSMAEVKTAGVMQQIVPDQQGTQKPMLIITLC